MCSLNRTIWSAISLTFLALVSFVNGQTAIDCQKLGNPFNENSDRFVGSWSGSVKGIQIAEKKFGDSEKPVETAVTLKIGNNGRLLEWYLSNDRIPMFGRHVYTYDELGRVTKRTSHNPDGTAVLEDIYTYNPSGNLLTEFKQNAKSKVVIGSKEEFKYESPTIYSQYSNGKFVRRITILLDEKCRVVKQILMKEKDELENVIELKYDHQDNIIENIAYSSTGRPSQKLKWEYEYDERRNWVKKRSFEWHFWDETDKYTIVSEEARTITYANPK